MFHWICPECGREIAPAVKECPTCDPANAASASVAHDSVTAGAAPHAAYAEPSSPALTPEVVFSPRVERSRYAVRESVLTLDAEPVENAAEPVEIAAQPVEIPAERVEIAAEPVEIGVEPDVIDAAPVEIVEPGTKVAQEAEAAAPEPSVPPAPPAPPDPAVAPKASLPEIEAAAPEAVRRVTGRPIPPEFEPVLTTTPIAAPVERTLCAALEQIKDQRALSPVQPPAQRHIALGPVPAAPPETQRPSLTPIGGCPPLADLVVDAQAVLRRLRAVPLDHRQVRGELREQITVPGPALPIELTSLEGAGISKILLPRAAKQAAARSAIPGWVLSGLVAATVVATCVWGALYLMPVDAAPAPPAPAETKVEATPVSPLAKFVEVTGFRHVTMGDQSEIRYLVVNHSAALMSDVTVFVTLRGPSAEPGAPPVSNFSFKMPKLGPWESKEMVSPVEKVIRPGAMPEWRDLVAEIEIGQ